LRRRGEMSRERGGVEGLSSLAAYLASVLPELQVFLSACLEAYVCLLSLMREFIDAQLRVLEEVRREVGEVRREKVKVE